MARATVTAADPLPPLPLAADPPASVLVLGGTGFVGRSVCEQLSRRGTVRITVPTRRLAHGRALRSLPTLHVEAADVHDPATLDRLVAGHDAVVHLVAILHGDAEAFERVHVELPRRLAHACRDHGVTRVVHVSALGVAADAPSYYLRTKALGEAALRDGGVAPTVLRPSVIFGADDRFMNLFARLQAFAPVMPLAFGDARLQPVWVDDVAAAVVAVLDRRDSVGATYECAGPTVYTLAELVRLAGRWSGHERPQIALPDALGRLQAAVLERLPGEPLMSRDNVASLRVPNVASGRHPGLDALGIVPTALEAIAPGYLGRTRKTRLDRWRRSARRI